MDSANVNKTAVNEQAVQDARSDLQRVAAAGPTPSNTPSDPAEPVHLAAADATALQSAPKGAKPLIDVAETRPKAKKVKQAKKRGHQDDDADQAGADNDAAAATSSGDTGHRSSAELHDGRGDAKASKASKLTQSTSGNTDDDLSGLTGVLVMGGVVALSAASAVKVIKKGFLIDSPVAGADYYINGVYAGQTAADGSFNYSPGDKVSFKIGTVSLGENVTVSTDGRVMMQDLAGVPRSNASDLTVLRLAQLLQSLDADNNPDNGITIDRDRLKENLPDTEIEDKTVVASLLKDNVKVVEESDALDHLNNNSDMLKGMDDTPPTATISFGTELLVSGETATVTVTFSEAVMLWDDWSELLVLSGGGTLGDFVTEDEGLTFTATYTPPSKTTGTVTLALSDDYTDLAGNRGMEESAMLAVDTEASVATILLPPRVQKLEPAGVTGGNDFGSGITQVGTDGSYVVVWNGQDSGEDDSIMVQQFNADGTPKGAPVVLEAPAAVSGFEAHPKVMPIGADGAFMVTFVGVDANDTDHLYMQKFNADGSKASETAVELVLPNTVNRNGAIPEVAALGDNGDFALVFAGSDGDDNATIVVQKFDATGAAVGDAVTLNADADAALRDIDPQITALGDDGSYVVVWEGTDGDNGRSVYVQKMNADGTPSGDSQTLNAPDDDIAYSAYPQVVPVGNDGRFMVIWEGFVNAGLSRAFMQSFDADGSMADTTPVALPDLDNANGAEKRPSITAIGDQGDFLVAYKGADSSGAPAIVVQKYAADGSALGGATYLDAMGGDEGQNAAPKITLIGTDGAFAVSWEGSDVDGDSSVYVQRFNEDGVADVEAQGVNAENVDTRSIGLTASEPGAAFLVHSSVDMSLGLDALTETNSGLWNSVAVPSAGEPVNITTAGLTDGTYRLYTVDANGNLSAAVPGVISIDQTRPVLTITDDKATGIAAGDVTYTFSFSEAVKNFSADDITLQNGSKGVFTAVTTGENAGKVFTLVVTPTLNQQGADIGVSVGTSWTDLAGNTAQSNTDAAAQAYDRLNPLAPSVSLKDDTGPSSSDSISRLVEIIASGEEGATFEFSNNVRRGYAGDFFSTPPEAVEGINTIYVRQVDAAGNRSPNKTYIYWLDTTVATQVVSLDSDTGSDTGDMLTNASALKVLSVEFRATVEYSTDNTVWSTTAPTPTQGSNTVYVRQLDIAGNYSTVTSITYTYDSVVAKPVLALAEDTGTSSTDGITRNPQVNVTGLEAGGTWDYQIDGTGEWIAGSGTSFNAINGEHSYVVRQTDAAGNTATSTALSFTTDTAGEIVQVDLVTGTNTVIDGDATNDATAKLRVTKSSTDVAQYRFVTEDNLNGTWIDVGASNVITLGEGTFNVETRKIDVAGNYVESMTRVTKDTSALAPTMTLVEDTGTAGDGITTNAMVKIGGLESQSKWEMKIDDATTWAEFPLTAGQFKLLAGTHKYYLRQTDQAGNLSEVADYTFTYQSEVPSPVLKLANDTGISDGDFITQTTVMNVTGLADGATWQYRKNGGAWVDGTGSSFTMVPNPAGDVYEVRQNVAGKYSEASTAAKVVIDTAGPSNITVALQSDSGTSASDGITNSSKVAVSGLETGARLQVRVDGGDWRSVEVKDAQQLLQLEDGTHSYDFRQLDAAGNASAIVTKTYTYLNADMAAPTMTLAADTGGAGDNVTSNKQINVALAVAGTGVTWQYQVDNSGNWIDGTGSFFNATAGQHSYKVRQVDVAGNTSPASAEFAVNFDGTKPATSSYQYVALADSDSEGPKVIPTSQVLHTVTATDATAVRFSMDAHDALALDSATGKITFKQPTGYIEGGNNSYSTTVTITDAAGNTATQTVSLNVNRTNTGAPQVNLGDYKTGMSAVGGRDGASMLSDGSYLFGNMTYVASTGSFQYIPRHVSASGAVLNTFAVPDNTRVVSGWVSDAQDRVYIMVGIGKAPLNTSPYTYTNEVQILRYSKEGVLDTTYGTNGVVKYTAEAGKALTFPLAYSTAADMEIGPDGRLAVTFVQATDSTTIQASTSNPVVLDISPTGSITSTAVLPRTGMQSYETAFLSDMALGGDGVLYGVIYSNGQMVKMVNGAIDTSYNANTGKKALVGYETYLIESDASNRLIYLKKTGSTIEVYRLNADGAVDSSFGTSGKTVLTMPATVGDAALTYDATTGKIMVAGTSTSGDAVFQLQSNGAIDSSFANNGMLQLSVTGTLINGVRSAGIIWGLYYNAGKLMIYAEGEGGQSYGATTRIIDMVAEVPLDTYGRGILTTTEGSRPVGMLTGRSLISDADLEGKAYNGMSVMVSRQTGQNADDVFGARGDLMFTTEGRMTWKGTDIGSVNNASGLLYLQFNDKADAAIVNDALRAITYRNANPLQTDTVNLNWTISDNDPVGAKTTTAILAVNIKNDNTDVGDPLLVGKSNDTVIDMSGYFTVGGKKYYYSSGTSRATLDNFFNAGEDTSDTARTAVMETGVSVKLLTKDELTTLWARSDLPVWVQKSTLQNMANALPSTVYVATATKGANDGTHINYNLESAANAFETVADTAANAFNYAIYEVIESPDPQPAFVDPLIRLVVDNGDSNADRYTSDGRFELVGMNTSLDYEVSGDGGVTWVTKSAGNMIFEMPEGRYEAGKIMVRQTDASGFVDTVTSTAQFRIDKTIKSLGLANDQGLSLTDGITADGTITLNGINAALPYEYSTDYGATWKTGGTLANGAYGFVLPTGTYQASQVRIRQTDTDGTTSSARSSAVYKIDPLDGQGDIKLAWDNGTDTKDGVTSYEFLNVTGLKVGLAFEVSTDGGATWTTKPATTATTASFAVPEGSYAANGVKVRQTDATGYTTEIGNRGVFAVDKTVKTVALFNDQGTTIYDNVTADARVVVKGLNKSLPYQYSIDGGSTWQTGAKVGDELVVTVPAGTYTAEKLQARQTDGNGLTTFAKSFQTLTISSTKGQGDVSIGFDSGPSNTDGVTYYKTFYVSGLRDNLDWDFSLDGGATWTAGTLIKGFYQQVTLPDGSYPANAIQLRQTDAKGYTTLVKNSAAYVVDNAIAKPEISLVNDSGYSNTDKLTADGRIEIKLTGSVGANDLVQYTTDGGGTWVDAAASATQTITLANGTYKGGSIRVKVADAAGNNNAAILWDEIKVDNTDTSGPVFTSANKGVALDRDGTATNFGASSYWPSLTVQTTDANQVYYSLSGAQANLFNISDNGRITFKQLTQLVNPLGDTYALTVTATDAFGNTSTQDVTINVVDDFEIASSTVGSYWDAVEGNRFEINFTHNIALASGAVIKLESVDGQTPAITLNVNDPAQVSISGNKLTLNIAGAAKEGKYKINIDNAVKSVITDDIYDQSDWSQLGFNIDRSVVYDAGGVSAKGSFVVASNDGGSAKGGAAILGDVNGDGIDDWAMSVADGDVLGRSDNGKTYVVFGRSDGGVTSLNDVANGIGGFMIAGENSGDLAGMSVASAGDVNNDGKQDIALHAAGGDGKGWIVYGQTGTNSVYLGNIAGNSSLGRVFTSSAKDSFGAIGDINGDGYDDVAHGRVDLQRTTTLSRVEYSTSQQVVEGKIIMKADWLNFVANWVEVGLKIADFIDDPISATIENAVEWEDNLELAMGGEDRLDPDGPNFDPVAKAMFDMTIQVKGKLAANQDLVGWSYTKSGGDSGGLFEKPKDTVYTMKYTIESKVSTTYTTTTTLFGAGETIVEYGGPNGATKKITGTINGQQVGTEVTALGDINGDGRADFGVLDTGSGGVLARMNVVFGSKSNEELFTNNFDNGTGGFRISDPARTTEYVGEGSIAGIGDVNGDGINDFTVSLDTAEAPTYVVYGKAGMTGVNLAQVAAGNGGYMLAKAAGFSTNFVDAIGDYNGDGLDDFVYYTTSANNSATWDAYVVFGGASNLNVSSHNGAALVAAGRGFAIEGGGSNYRFANTNAVTAGDINGDGLTDLMLRGSKGETVVLMGSADSGRNSQINVDQMGTTGNDSLTSTGTQLLVGGLGHDTITTVGADVVLAGAGDDRVILSQSTLTALQNNFGSGGNTTQLAKIDGGSGLDTLQLSGGMTLDLRLISNKMVDLDNISSRLANIEKIDMHSDTAANTLKITLNDVLDMGSSNVMSTTTGWQNLSGGEMSGTVTKTQVAVTAGSNDRVELRSSEWTATGGIVRETATGQEYNVYNAKDGVAAQILVDKDAIFGWV